MVSRKDIAKRSKAKTLQRVNLDKKNNPNKYNYESSEFSLFLALNYDFNNGALSPLKMKEYERLKEIYGKRLKK